MQHPAIGHDDAKSAVTLREIRKATRPEPDLALLYDALGLAHQPGGVQKLLS
jgi:hypothetical protein